MPVAIDHSLYPHIIDTIIECADPQALNRLRTTSTAFLERVEAQFAKKVRHVIMADHKSSTTSTGRGKGIAFTGAGTGERFLPLLSTKTAKDLLHASGNLKHLRARYRAIRVLDVDEVVYNGVRAVSDIVDQLDTFRVLGPDQKFDFYMRPKHLVINYDLVDSFPLAQFSFEGLSTFVVNFRVSERPQNLSSVMPANMSWLPLGDGTLEVVFNFEQYTCERKLCLLEGEFIAEEMAQAACGAGAVTLVGIEHFTTLYSQVRPWQPPSEYPKIPCLPPCLELPMVQELVRQVGQQGYPGRDGYGIDEDQCRAICQRISVMSSKEYEERVGAKQYAILTAADIPVSWTLWQGRAGDGEENNKV